MSAPAWLPARLDRTTFADDAALEVAAWAVFQNDFAAFPQFRAEEVRVDRTPHKARADREHTYWHAVTDGQPEEARKIPELERLERTPWTKPLIENEACPLSTIKVWSNRRHGNKHICIWFDRVNYLVVLKQLTKNYLLKTTYCPEANTRRRMHKEYAAWKKSGARL